MLKPVLDCALDGFIRGLPDDMSIFVDTRNPRDLSEAMEYALHIEERLDYTEKTRALASIFHVTKRDGESENCRPVSPYTRQMVSTDKHEKKVSHENSKMVTFRTKFHASIIHRTPIKPLSAIPSSFLWKYANNDGRITILSWTTASIPFIWNALPLRSFKSIHYRSTSTKSGLEKSRKTIS